MPPPMVRYQLTPEEKAVPLRAAGWVEVDGRWSHETHQPRPVSLDRAYSIYTAELIASAKRRGL